MYSCVPLSQYEIDLSFKISFLLRNFVLVHLCHPVTALHKKTLRVSWLHIKSEVSLGSTSHTDRSIRDITEAVYLECSISCHSRYDVSQTLASPPWNTDSYNLIFADLITYYLSWSRGNKYKMPKKRIKLKVIVTKEAKKDENIWLLKKRIVRKLWGRVRKYNGQSKLTVDESLSIWLSIRTELSRTECVVVSHMVVKEIKENSQINLHWKCQKRKKKTFHCISR